MNTNRAILILLVLAVGFQVAILVKPGGVGQSKAPAPEAVRNAPSGTKMPLEGLMVKGGAEAKLVLLEFSDYECPYCARHATSVGDDIEKKYVATGKLKYAFINNPLPMHNNAKLLAIAAICAGRQNHYWEMHNILFRSKPKTRDEIIAASQPVGLDMSEFDKCLDVGNQGALDEIAKDMKRAGDLGLQATPSFALGWLDENHQVHVKTLMRGAQPLASFEGIIEGMFKKGPVS